ncbi:hypothetical protein LTS15_004138 [Exophiala xenobiotica]|nr:hypothetical protein LTS15_004138 [Exophiala xenobiotica]
MDYHHRTAHTREEEILDIASWEWLCEQPELECADRDARRSTLVIRATSFYHFTGCIRETNIINILSHGGDPHYLVAPLPPAPPAPLPAAAPAPTIHLLMPNTTPRETPPRPSVPPFTPVNTTPRETPPRPSVPPFTPVNQSPLRDVETPEPSLLPPFEPNVGSNAYRSASVAPSLSSIPEGDVLMPDQEPGEVDMDNLAALLRQSIEDMSALPPKPDHKRAPSIALSQRSGPGTPIERIVKRAKPITPEQKEAAKIEDILGKLGTGMTPERRSAVDQLTKPPLSNDIKRFTWKLIQQCHDVAISKKLAYRQSEMPTEDEEQIKEFGTKKILTAIKDIVDKLPRQVPGEYVKAAMLGVRKLVQTLDRAIGETRGPMVEIERILNQQWIQEFQGADQKIQLIIGRRRDQLLRYALFY